MGGLLSELDRFQMTHWKPGKGQMSPELLAQEAAKQREQALYAQPTDPTVAGYNVSENLPPHLRPAWRGMGLLGEALALSAMKENPGTVGLLTDVASSVPMTKGLLAMAALPGSLKGIRAFHGSPHDFDRFDLSKIGTGEGAQAYGHGLYFAESEGVARSYRNRLAGGKIDNVKPDEEALSAIKQKWDEIVAQLRAERAANGDRMTEKSAALQNHLDALNDHAVADTLARKPYLKDGRMYEVNINAHPDEFLDWDNKKLRDQIPREVLDMESRRFYKMSVDDINDGAKEFIAKRAIESPEAVKAMAQSGIPGIKYLDQGSRASGDGSRNYVVFDDKLIDIMRKYGIGPFAVGGAMAMTGGDQP